MFMLMGVAIILVTHPITVILHELGHAIPAILFTRKKVTVFIGSYGEAKKSVNFSCGLLEVHLKKSIFWRTGLCQTSATSLSQTKKFIFIVCGPLASLTFAIVTSYFVFSYDMHGVLKMVMSFFTLAAAWDFFSNIIPNNHPVKLADGRVCYNDGNSLRELFYYKRFLREYQSAAELYDQKEFHKSAVAFKDILQLGFQHEDIYRLAYASCLLNHQYQEAYEYILDFGTKFSLNSDDYYNLGYLSTFRGVGKENENYFEKSLELNPNNPHALNAIGYILNTKQRFKEARSYFEKALAIDPEHSYAMNNLGHAKIEMEELEEGLAYINHSLELNNDNSYAYRNLGIYHLKLKNFTEAERFLLKAKSLDKDTELIEELLAKVTVEVS
jgi:tetratricopeptide (TPR) repeat protein